MFPFRRRAVYYPSSRNAIRACHHTRASPLLLCCAYSPASYHFPAGLLTSFLAEGPRDTLSVLRSTPSFDSSRLSAVCARRLFAPEGPDLNRISWHDEEVVGDGHQVLGREQGRGAVRQILQSLLRASVIDRWLLTEGRRGYAQQLCWQIERRSWERGE